MIERTPDSGANVGSTATSPSQADAAATTLRRANPDDVPLIADLIAHAFWDLLPAAWLVPDALVRRRVLAGQFGIVVEHALEHGHIDLTADIAGVAGGSPAQRR